MAIVTLKDSYISSQDNIPPLRTGVTGGAPGAVQIDTGYVTAASGDSAGSIYRLCRIKTNSKVQDVQLNSNIAGGGAGDIDVAYSSAGTATLWIVRGRSGERHRYCAHGRARLDVWR
jgi:hypothetical protein